MIFNHQERDTEGFPNGSVVKTLSANVGDMGSIPGPGRSHMLRDNEACMPHSLQRLRLGDSAGFGYQ